MPITPIYKIQGNAYFSPFSGQRVTTQGVVTGIGRRGFFIQDVLTSAHPPADSTGCSHALFVYYKGRMPPIGTELLLTGKVVDYLKVDPTRDKPVTQLHFDAIEMLEKNVELPKPIVLTGELLINNQSNLADFLNAHESMLFSIKADAEFLQASNPFGDYVVLPKGLDMARYAKGSVRASAGGYIFDAENIDCWLPSFRTADVKDAPRVDVGARLTSDIEGPLYYRSGAYQIVTAGSFSISPSREAGASLQSQSGFRKTAGAIRVMTVNCLNLDPIIESAQRVKNPALDIDDDVGNGQFRRLGSAIVSQGGAPEIIALQEIQDDDGAELTDVREAGKTYALLIEAIEVAGGPRYQWADIPPELHADGGQPGGNIRNGFLYRDDIVELVDGSMLRIGEDDECFEGSRKPLMATFRAVSAIDGLRQQLSVINVHLASKRHQASLFALENPSFDARESVRVQQAALIVAATRRCRSEGVDFYVTGDFNDVQGSQTLAVLLGASNCNLVDTLEPNDRYDYNHRGKLHALMHGIVDQALLSQQRANYEILHGNELTGVRPGSMGNKASDHAYVIAQIVQ